MPSNHCRAVDLVLTLNIEFKTYNKVILMGKLGRDPEFLTFPNSTNGKWSLSLATVKSVPRKTDSESSVTWDKETVWHRIVMKGTEEDKLFSGDRFRKGATVMIEGKLDYWKSETSTGVNIVADKIDLVRGSPTTLVIDDANAGVFSPSSEAQ